MTEPEDLEALLVEFLLRDDVIQRLAKAVVAEMMHVRAQQLAANSAYKGRAKEFDDARIRELHAQGLKPRQIVAELGCSRYTVHRAIRKAA